MAPAVLVNEDNELLTLEDGVFVDTEGVDCCCEGFPFGACPTNEECAAPACTAIPTVNIDFMWDKLSIGGGCAMDIGFQRYTGSILLNQSIGACAWRTLVALNQFVNAEISFIDAGDDLVTCTFLANAGGSPTGQGPHTVLNCQFGNQVLDYWMLSGRLQAEPSSIWQCEPEPVGSDPHTMRDWVGRVAVNADTPSNCYGSRGDYPCLWTPVPDMDIPGICAPNAPGGPEVGCLPFDFALQGDAGIPPEAIECSDGIFRAPCPFQGGTASVS